jgi:hypothetical protein
VEFLVALSQWIISMVMIRLGFGIAMVGGLICIVKTLRFVISILYSLHQNHAFGLTASWDKDY